MGRPSLHGLGVLPDGALLDECDIYLVTGRACCVGAGQYVQVSVDGVAVLLHKLIFPEAEEVDHRNGNGLDNRRENLRPATHRQNLANQRPQVGRSSRFKGVSWDVGRSKWRAYIDKPQRHLGRFSDEIEAVRAYNFAALEAWGEFALLNDLEA